MLKEESKDELDGLIDILNEHPGVVIELKAHTDRWGSEDYNYSLSLSRARSVKDYLINHGINTERVIAVAVGKNEPKIITSSIATKYNFLNEGDVLNEEIVKTFSIEHQEIADQLNRRTEFKIIDF